MSQTHPLSILVNWQLRNVSGDIIWQFTTSVSDVELYKSSSFFVKQMVLAVAHLVTGNSVDKHPKQIPGRCEAVYSINLRSFISKCTKLIQNKGWKN